MAKAKDYEASKLIEFRDFLKEVWSNPWFRYGGAFVCGLLVGLKF